MVYSKTCFLSGAQRCDGCGWERWAPRGQQLIDVPILEIKKKKKKDMKVTTPEVICSFTCLLIHSFSTYYRRLGIRMPNLSGPSLRKLNHTKSYRGINEFYAANWLLLISQLKAHFPPTWSPEPIRVQLFCVVILKRQDASEFSRGLVETDSSTPNPGPETPFAFLTSSPVLLLRLVHRPYCEQLCSGTFVFSLELPMSQVHQRQNKESTFSHRDTYMCSYRTAVFAMISSTACHLWQEIYKLYRRHTRQDFLTSATISG